jgi:hypothetical protein
MGHTVSPPKGHPIAEAQTVQIDSRNFIDPDFYIFWAGYYIWYQQS